MLQKYTIDKVAEIFYKYPTKDHYLKGISKEIGLAHTSVKKHLEELSKLSIIKETTLKKGSRIFPIYKSDINNKTYRKYKTIYNLISLHESGVIDFLQDKLMPRAIIFFGSYQKGEDTEESDIDIFVECKKEELDLKKFENKLCRKIQLHFKENFKDYSKELKNNIINGITLKGFLEGYKWK